ncbi:hypothetical protein DTL21_02795 [Bremerella cremea]|uniref:AsmA-like C-terminal domain-containing protein n=1 Tax=Blastopirellula marina TaxID=124 RepID=A0A2S8G5W1_9BACT|nr:MULTISPECIES: hypothetical protein [Pirellulaceae]PQO39690.1 hypothetical protein C5Y83_02795 [Blastopirellula marina]RCS51157.1 hypothetical protein DTL21_02795 [Bremerella cremea]
MKKRPKDGDFTSETGSSNLGSAWSKWRPLVVVAGLVLLVLMLPSIAARTPMLSWGIAQATSGLNAQVRVDSASLGWFSPVILHDVHVVDLDGEPIAEIPSIRISKSLLGLISNTSDLGTIEINRATAHVVVHQGTSNIEKLFPEASEAPIDADSSGGPSTPRKFRLVVREATVHLADGNSSRNWTLEDVSTDVDWRDPTVPASCTFSANLRDRQQMGILQGKGTLPGVAGDTQFTLATKGLPLGVMELLASRIGEPCITQGELNGQIELVSSHAGPALRCNLEASQIAVRMLQSERGNGWNNGTLRATGEIALAGNQIIARQFTVTTDWGQVLADGIIPAGLTSATAPNASPQNLLGNQPWELRGTADLARLANAFPDLLQIRQGVELNEGRISINLANALDTGEPMVKGGAVISDIVATVNGRSAKWQQPLETSFALTMPEGELHLDTIACRSSFLTAEGQTNGPETNINFQLDANRLVTDLSQFVDLNGNQFAGTFDGSLQIQNQGAGRIVLAAQANGADALWSQGPQTLLSEKSIQTQIQSTLICGDGQVQQIESAIAMLKTGQTALSVQTSSGITLGEKATWPIKVQLQGPIDPVWAQLKAALGMDDFHIGGNGYVLAKLNLAPNQWDLEGVNIDVNDFALVGPLTQIHENKLKVEGSAKIDWDAQHFSAPQFVVVGTTVSARATKLAVPLGATGTASGQLAYRVDLSRGIHWVLPPQWLGQTQVAGEMAGTMTLAKDDQGIVLQNNGQIANWEVRVPTTAQPTQLVQVQPAAAIQQSVRWHEPNLAYMQSVSLNPQEDSLAIHDCQVQSSALSLSIKGGVSHLSTDGNLSINGQANYDWSKLSPILAAFMGPQVSIQGQQASNFQWAGPIWPTGESVGANYVIAPTWEAGGELAWKQANIYGIPTGETTMNTQLRQGVLQLTANSPEVSGGQLAFRSQLHLNATPMQWHLPRGRMIESVAITPQMCQGWLRYVAPILADATRVEGKFSLDIEAGRFPVFDPMQGEASGVLSIQGAEVRSGPLAQGYVALGRNVEALVKGKPASAIDQGSASLLTLPPQQVGFRLAGGRVYHENLIVQSGDVQMVTSGWVDANQQMQLMVSIPVKDNWIQKAPWLATMRGTAVTVPIRGSMQNPQIDSQVIENMARGMLNNAAQGAIQEGINRGLQELFRPR